jgi:hypothetical protein
VLSVDLDVGDIVLEDGRDIDLCSNVSTIVFEWGVGAATSILMYRLLGL